MGWADGYGCYDVWLSVQQVGRTFNEDCANQLGHRIVSAKTVLRSDAEPGDTCPWGKGWIWQEIWG